MTEELFLSFRIEHSWCGTKVSFLSARRPKEMGSALAAREKAVSINQAQFESRPFRAPSLAELNTKPKYKDYELIVRILKTE
jgi:hypothetical protein